MKLAFVGPQAVGKDAISNYIEKKYNIKHISSGDIIRKYVKDNNLGGLDRKNLQKVGNELRKKHGGDILIKMALENSSGDIILSGLRAIGEVETFKNLGGIVISVNAPIEKRYEWAKIRGRITDDVSFDDFKKIEEEEKANKNIESQNIDAVVKMANFNIENNSTLDEFFKKGDGLINNIKNSS